MTVFEQAEKVLEAANKKNLSPAFVVHIGNALTALGDRVDPKYAVKDGMELCAAYAKHTGRQEAEVISAYFDVLQEVAPLFNVLLHVVHVNTRELTTSEALRRAAARIAATLN